MIPEREGTSEFGSENLSLRLKTECVRSIANVLKAVNFRETCTISASDKGIRVTVDDLRCLQMSAFLQKELFREYDLKDEDLNVKTNLTVLCECLNVFGSGAISNLNPTLSISYAEYGCDLIVLLEEAGVVTDCAIKTLETDNILDFGFSVDRVMCKIIMQAGPLRDALSDMDPSADVIQFKILRDKFTVEASGQCGDIQFDFPRDSMVMESYDCEEEIVNKYRLSLLKPSVKILSVATKISLRTDSRGFLSIQYMIPMDEDQVAFVELYCCPEEEID